MMVEWTRTDRTSTGWRLCLLVFCGCCSRCSCLRNTYWSVDNGRVPYDVYPDNNTVTWWEAAQRGCGRGRLHVPRNLNMSGTVAHELQMNQPYWVAAMQYSTWKWNDGTPLYAYVGYRKVTEGDSVKAKLNDNSAFQCHIQCKNARRIGLRGKECYCLDGGASGQTENPELRCTGNYEEKCGNEEGMSVYKTDSLITSGHTLEPKQNGHCVYASLSFGGFILNMYQDDSCDNRRSAVCGRGIIESTRNMRCRNTICVSRNSYSWASANKTCNLIKISNSNKGDLKKAMKYSLLRHYTYWIGLKRVYTRRWLNGSQVLIPTEHNAGTERLCLAAELSTSRQITYTWMLCSLRLQPICETRSISPSTTTLHPALTSLQPTSDGSSDRTIASSTDNIPVVEEAKSSHQNNYHKGTVLGSSAAAIAVFACVLVTLIVIYRKKKLCFRKRQPLVFASLEESLNNLVSYDPTNPEIYLTAVHNNRARISFINNGCSERGSFSSVHTRKEHENEYICLSGSQGNSGRNVAGSGRGLRVSVDSSEYVQPDVSMGSLFSQSKTKPGLSSTGQTLNEYVLAEQAGHMATNHEGSDVYDHTSDLKHARSLSSDRMYDHTKSGRWAHDEVEYDIAGDDRTDGQQYRETYNRAETEGVPCTGVETGASKTNNDGDKNVIYTNYISAQDDHTYGNEQNLHSPTECDYYNISLAENVRKLNK